jgi:hypothetical protein
MCYAFFFVTTAYVVAKTTTLVNWTNSYARRRIGGINLVDLKEGLNALLNKCILLVLELGESNLKTLLHHNMNQCKPSIHKRWVPNIH